MSTKITPEKIEYNVYRNKEFGFMLEFPKNWDIKVQKPLSGFYAGGLIISIQGPKESKSGVGYNVLSLWVVPKNQHDREFTSLNEYASNSIMENSVGLPRILSDNTTTISGLDAREISICYDTYRPLDSPRELQKLIVTKIKWIVMERNGYFFELEYHSSENDFNRYVPVYEHAKSTFRFI
jgi:hypothetical protein